MEINILVESLEPENSATEPGEQIFSKSEVSIGRAKTNDLVLTAGDVSSKHARLFIEKREDRLLLFLTDLGSSNGTFLEDVRIESNLPVELSQGQRIVIGSFLLTPSIQQQQVAIELEDVFTSEASPSIEERIAEMLPEVPGVKANEEPVAEIVRKNNRPAEVASVTGVIPRTAEWSFPSMLEDCEVEHLENQPSLSADSSVAESPKAHQKENTEAVLEALRGLQLVCSRVSHVLRTPLGVAMGTLADARAAGEVEKQVLDDGEQAQQLILEKLHFLKLLATQIDGEFREVRLEQVLQEHFAKRVTVRGFPWTMSLPETLPQLRLDVAVVLKAVDALIFYLSAKYSGTENAEFAQVVLRVVQVVEEVVIELEFSKPAAAERFVHEGLADMGDVGHSEHFIESVALVYADLVARLHGGRAEVHVHELNEISLVMLFPVSV